MYGTHTWTGGGGSAYTPPGLVVSCGVGISVVWVREVVLIPCKHRAARQCAKCCACGCALVEHAHNCMCALLGLHGSVQAAGVGQRVQGGLAEPSAGARGPPGAARRRAWAVQAQRHLTFAVLFVHGKFFDVCEGKALTSTTSHNAGPWHGAVRAHLEQWRLSVSSPHMS